MSGKPLDQLLEQTDPEGCHITNLPSRIWVFGGPCGSSELPVSLRDSFWRKSLNHHPAPNWFIDLDRPEDNDGWLEHSGYADLLEFERDACYLAKATVLFAESPGAYAELGAIAIDESLLPRLAVVVQHRYRVGNSRDSFLNLGPLRRVEGKGRLCVIGTETSHLPEHDFEDILATVDQWLPKTHKKEKLQPSNPTHRLLLVADLVDILLVASEPELISALKHFGVSISLDELKKSLGLLKYLEFIALHQAGMIPYWVRHDAENGPWADYTSSSQEFRFERARFKVKAAEIISENTRLKSIYERGRR